MRTCNFKSLINTALRVACLLPFAAVAAFGQQQVNLTAAPTMATLPDGSVVPMWGYSCAPALAVPSTATCAALNKSAAAAGMWSPVVITVPSGQDLQINLTNKLSFTPTGATSPNTIPTSLVIVGQLGGGLGSTASYKDSPTHAAQGATWPIAGDTNGATFTPPIQGQRVQSFSTEVAFGATTALTWTAPRPGTYLIESGTHPSFQGPMGLYGMLVVTTAPRADNGGKEIAAGTAYPGVTYDADVPLLLSEIDSVQNQAVSAAVSTVGFSETAARVLRDSVSSVLLTLDANGNVINAGTGYNAGDTVTISEGGFSVQATAKVGTVDGSGAITSITVINPGKGYSSVPTATATSGTGHGALLTAALSLAGVMCSDSAAACYPPAVNYTPLYYLVNGAAFNKTNANASLFPLTPATLTPAGGAGTGSVLVRFVNAGLRMHVPAIVGSLTGQPTPLVGLSLIAEDGNPLPGLHRVQNEVFMAAGKTYDVLINGPAGGVSAVNITSAGAGYTSSVSAINYTSNSLTGCTSPTVSITPVDGIVGSAATVSLTMDSTGTIKQINLLTVGAGYDSAPLVSVTDSAASCTNLSISTSLAPLPVNFSGGGGAGAGATATISGGAIAAITVTHTGNGYTSDPAVMINDTPAPTTAALAIAVIKPGIGTFPVYDRELSLSANAISRDAGMLAYIGIDGGNTPTHVPALAPPTANNDTYNVVHGNTLTVSDPSRGVIANDVNVYGVQVTATVPAHGTLTLNPNGTFTYVPDASWTATTSPTTSDSFIYMANGNSAVTATVSLNACTTAVGSCLEASTGITVNDISYTSNVATSLSIKSPGILSVDKDAAGYPLSVAASSVTLSGSGWTLSVDKSGAFNANVPAPGTYTFSYQAQNSQGTLSASGGSGGTSPGTGTATVTLIFPAGSGLAVKVLDGADKKTTISDYRWIIEEDRTFYIDPNCTTNPPASGCPTFGSGIVPTFGTNFHTSYMPVVAAGCTGILSCESGQTLLGAPAVCDISNGGCRTDAIQETAVDPRQVVLDPQKRYYISVLPGDAANPFAAAYASAPTCVADSSNNSVPSSTCGHGMGGAPITFGQSAVTVLTQPTPFPPAKLSVFVFEDDFPLNGEHDAGGGIDVLASNEPGLGGFQITLFDDAGGPGDATGQPTYDMFNMPLSNSLSGTIDPANGNDACPISSNARTGFDGTVGQLGITSMIVTCPKYESDGTTLSPLAGQAVIANLYPGRYGVVATPGADRIARGEEWLQTNTLDGQKAHDSFLRIGEPSFFQEFGPAGYHVTIGFANPKTINDRLPGVCNGSDPILTGNGGTCGNTVTGLVTTERMSRTPDERLYSSGDNRSFAFTQCYVSIGDPDGEDFAFTKCDASGNFTLSGLPDGDWRVTVFDQWNDMLVDGLSTPVRLGATVGGVKQTNVNMGQIAMNQWQANIYTSTFFDQDGNGVRGPNEPGLTLVPTNIRFRDGSFSNFNNTDLNGNAGFNEIFPLFSWYVVETDTSRYKSTGTHVVYDAGGPADGTCTSATAPCGSSNIGQNMANTSEQVSLPSNLRVPGAVYCDNADCTGFSVANGPGSSATTNLSTGRIDPAWVETEGWQGFSGQNSFIEFGKKPFVPGENGGIHGHVVYASTRPFDDPQLLVQLQWEPQVPNVTINLYQEGTAADGTKSLKLVDTTLTSSWDAWAQGFRSDGVPNMNCPGQGRDTGTNADVFFFSLFNQPNTLNPGISLPNNSQFKCYDGMHNWNQVQPAPYDGAYRFPSVTSMDPTNGKPLTTNCTVCVPNPDASDPYRSGTPMLPAGKYVVEVVVPPGYELEKEEDKNILIGDNYIAPVTQQFAGLGNIFIIPDQAAVGAAYNSYNPQNPTQNLGTASVGGIDAAPTQEQAWPCVGASRIVPDFISLFPQSQEVSPFAGATRNLCDRKEVTVQDQASSLARFYIFTSTHVAAHFTGVITDDFTSEFDPFSPQFGEKFSPANLPIAIKDWTGSEIARVYSDHWGSYNGLTYSTWEVNPPNPTGYAPTMMVTCMNDPGTGTVPDPLYNPAYSQFCYEIPFMPGATQYMDTPVVPTSAFAGAGYNNPDCAYPDATPAISEVDGDGIGPWVSAAGHTLTIKALGNVLVNNNAYSGPSSTTAPYNAKTVNRHYGFGTQCMSVSAGSTSCNTLSSVTIGGKTATIQPGGWTDSQITVTVPSGVSNCALQQQAQYTPAGTTSTQCGEVVITAGNGKQSVDTVTVTIGGKAPTHVPTDKPTIQAAIDAAHPGDLIIVKPGAYNEMVLMWKPVRLQGVGAASSVINANTHPAGKLDPWRRAVGCLFGLAINGQPYTAGDGTNPYDSSGTFTCPGAGWTDFAGLPNNPQVDRLPREGVVGWDTTVNGNLAEMLQEPSLMGAYEGAGITVLSKGVNIPAGATDVFGSGAEAEFPAGSTLLVTIPGVSSDHCEDNPNPYPSNFHCNPSRIDGLSITNSSQGGGGIFVHGWGHNLEIANNRVTNNAGTLTGGISIGQGEFTDAYLAPNSGTISPGSCQDSLIPNTQLPYCFYTHVNVHHNSITSNSSTGDELFSATPGGAGGVSFCTGADYYKFNHNWVCGNLSTGDGGGLAHLGFIWNGDIENNTFLFNQSTNPTIPTNGGGLIVQGAPPDGFTPTGLECGSVTDVDCVPGLGDGAGPGLVINANLIMGNAAESGSGGGLRFQAVNGTEVPRFPLIPELWYSVSVTNNIIANNVAGWDGGGVSLEDSLAVNFINNTVISNDTTASSGVLFNTLGAPLASSQSPPPPTGQTTSTTASAPQPAGLVVLGNSPQLTGALPARIICPVGHGNTLLNMFATNGPCKKYSVPLLYNDVLWQNRSFYIGVGTLGSGSLNQQNVVALYDAFTTTRAPSQPQAEATSANGSGIIVTGGTGACVSPSSYWDIGVRGDSGPSNHSSGLTLAPNYSVLTDAGDYPGAHNTLSNPTVVSQYCNGSRVPPELGSMGYQVPPGISDATVPNPIFNLTPAATVDEGNNWINISWGPLDMTNPLNGSTLGNYSLASSSAAINYIPSSALFAYMLAPSTDFFGHPRKGNNAVDAGAVEFVPPNFAIASVTGEPLVFGNVLVGTTSASQTLTVHNTGGATLTGITVAVTAPFSRTGAGCGTTLAAGSTCTINIAFSPVLAGAVTGTATITASVSVAGSPASLSGTGIAAIRTATVSPSPLAFGNWATGTTSNARTLTVMNSGNVGLAGGTFTFAGGSPQPFSRPGGSAGGNCGATLAVGASCTINVVFAPPTATAFSRTLTVAYTGATVTPTPVSLTGTGVAARAALSITPNPLTITLTTGALTGTGIVTLANTAPSTGAQTTVSNVGVSGGSALTYFFSVGALAGPDNCTGTTLAPGASCTVTVRFTNVTSPRGMNRAGTITFTDNGAGSPQSGALIGHANP
jgi:hypothetical protein